MTVTSTEYKHQKINMWPKTFRGDHEIYQQLSMGFYNKINLKGGIS